MIVDLIKNASVIEVRIGPRGQTGQQGDQGPQGDEGPAGAEATPITDIIDDGSGNLTIYTADASYGPFYLKGPQGDQGPAGAEATPITSISDDGFGNLTINTASASYGPFALKGADGSDGEDGTNATPITNITDDGNGNLTIYTYESSYGPFYLKGPAGNDGSNGNDGNTGPEGPQGPAGTNATPITSITDDGSGNLTINTQDSSFGPFALKGADGTNGNDGSNATPITNITDDGNGNLTIYTYESSYGPFYLKGPPGNDGGQGPQGDPGPEGPAGPTTWDGITDKPTTFPPSAHTHSAADITTGTVATARLGSGTASASTYLRGDGAWAAVSGGLTNIWIGAGEMIPRVTTGCSINSLESTTNRVNYDVLEFDAATAQYAQFSRVMPTNWNAGTITFKPYWTAASGSGNVIWGLQARAFANDDAIDQAFGTAQTSTDTLTAAADLDIGPASSAITIAGSPASGNLVIFQLYRDAAAGGDTLGTAAQLVGVEITFS